MKNLNKNIENAWADIESESINDTEIIEEVSSTTPMVSVEDLPFAKALTQAANANHTYFDGDKFFGGFGDTKLFLTDYWTLRQRSKQLFNENLYARGLLRRLITNEINTGLNLEATPNGDILGLNSDFLNEWSENVESRFQIWGDNPHLCDHKGLKTFGALQRACRLEALVEGDALVITRQSRKNNLPNIEIISGSLIQTPLDAKPRVGNKIKHGIELDDKGRHIAFHVKQENGSSVRIPAFGERSGRRLAWMVYGTDKLIDELRGQPLLSLILQSLKEIDRYRDSAQRKALINSILAMFIEKTQDKQGTLPLTAGAVRKDTANITDSDGQERKFDILKQIPGSVVQELQTGEKPVVHSTAGTDVNFGVFEASIIHAIAWANEIPPGILQLAFSSNYSASQGEKMEFKMYLDKSRSERADEFDKPIYIEWLLNEIMLRKIEADGLIEAWRDPKAYDTFGAWIQSDWAGAIKPNTDLKKEVSGYSNMVKEGFVTRTRSARELTGMKYTTVMKQQKTENEQRIAALEPFFEAEKKFPDSKILAGIMAAEGINITDIEDILQGVIEDNVAPSS